MPIFTDRFKRYVDTKISEIELTGSGIKKFNTSAERLGYNGQDGEVVADLETDLIYIWDSPTNSWKETGHTYSDLEARFQPKGDYALKSELHSHSNKATLDRLGINSNNKLTIDGQEVLNNGGSTVSDSTTNGNIVVDGQEIKVYDDSSIIQELGQKANVTDIPVFGNKETLDKIGEDENGDLIFNGSPISGAGSGSVVEKSQTNGNILVDGEEIKVYDDSSIIQELGQKADKTEIPDVSNLATKDELATATYDDTEIKSELEDHENRINILEQKPIGGGLPSFQTLNDFTLTKKGEAGINLKDNLIYIRQYDAGESPKVRLIPNLTSNSQDGYLVEESGPPTNYPPYNLFNDAINQTYKYGTQTTGATVTLTLPSLVEIDQIDVQADSTGYYDYTVKDFNFYVDNNGVWEKVLTVTNQTGWKASEIRSFAFPPQKTNKVKIEFVGSNDTSTNWMMIGFLNLLKSVPEYIPTSNKVEPSNINGNIIVDGEEIKVYDDNEIQSTLSGFNETIDNINRGLIDSSKITLVAMDGTPISSPDYGSNVRANAFDKNPSTFFSANNKAVAGSSYLGMIFNEEHTITKIRLLQVSATTSVTSVKVSVTNDGGTTWEDRPETYNTSNLDTTFNLAEPLTGNGFKIVANSNSNGWWAVSELEFYEDSGVHIDLKVLKENDERQNNRLDVLETKETGIPQYENINSFPAPEQLNQIVFNKEDASFYRSIGIGNGDPIPQMDGNTKDGITVSASSVYQNSSRYFAFNAFDDNNTTYWTPNVNNTGWLQIDFGKQRTIRQYGFKINLTDYAPKDFTFQGSNDGVNWDILDSQSITDWTTGEARNWDIENPRPYQYYKLDITSVNRLNYQPQIWELNVVEQLWERLTETPEEIENKLIALENSIINKNSSSQTIPAGQEITINNIPQNAIVQVETDLGDSSYLVNDPEIQIKKVGSDLIIKNNGATDKNVNVIIL
jgi:hypothetical protein